MKSGISTAPAFPVYLKTVHFLAENCITLRQENLTTPGRTFGTACLYGTPSRCCKQQHLDDSLRLLLQNVPVRIENNQARTSGYRLITSGMGKSTAYINAIAIGHHGSGATIQLWHPPRQQP